MQTHHLVLHTPKKQYIPNKHLRSQNYPSIESCASFNVNGIEHWYFIFLEGKGSLETLRNKEAKKLVRTYEPNPVVKWKQKESTSECCCAQSDLYSI